MPDRIPLPDGEVVDVSYVPGANQQVAQGAAPAAGRVQPQAPGNPSPVAGSGGVQAPHSPGVNAPPLGSPGNPYPPGHPQATVVVENPDGTTREVEGVLTTQQVEPGFPADEAPAGQPSLTEELQAQALDAANAPVARLANAGVYLDDQLLPSQYLLRPARIEHHDADDRFVLLTLQFMVQRVETDASEPQLVEEVPYHEATGDVSQLDETTAKAMDLFYRTQAHLRRFVLQRNRDNTGVTGTGVVAEGVLLTDGRVVLRWLGERSSIVLWDDLDKAIAVHGHDGATRLRWLDVPSQAQQHRLHPDNPALVEKRAAAGLPSLQRG